MRELTLISYHVEGAVKAPDEYEASANYYPRRADRNPSMGREGGREREIEREGGTWERAREGDREREGGREARREREGGRERDGGGREREAADVDTLADMDMTRAPTRLNFS